MNDFNLRELLDLELPNGISEIKYNEWLEEMFWTYLTDNLGDRISEEKKEIFEKKLKEIDSAENLWILLGLTIDNFETVKDQIIIDFKNNISQYYGNTNR